eukprot:12197634-Ditylum_brightwellii.AAC.1
MEESLQSGIAVASVIRRLQYAEADRKMYSTIKWYLKGDQKMGINYVEVQYYNLYWWLSAQGVSLIVSHSEWSWIQAIQILLVLSAT